jgi:hypothetical protein
MAGFEPATSCSQSRRANQAALHPVGSPKPTPGRPGTRRGTVRYAGAARPPRGRSSMAEPQPSKLVMRVRFPSPAPPQQPSSEPPRAPKGPPSRHASGLACPLRARCTRATSFPPGADEGLAHSRCDGIVSLPGRVLVDHRCPRAGVAHPFHQLAKASARGRRQSVPGMPQIVQVHARQPDLIASLDPQVTEVRPAKSATLRADKDKAVIAVQDEALQSQRSSGTISSGTETTRRPARDLGSSSIRVPSFIWAIDRTTRIVRDSRSMSPRRSAASSPNRKLANVARSRRAR